MNIHLKFSAPLALCISMSAFGLFPVSGEASAETVLNKASGQCIEAPTELTSQAMRARSVACKVGQSSQSVQFVKVNKDQWSVRNAAGTACLNLKASTQNREGGEVYWVGCSGHIDQLWDLTGLQTSSGMQNRLRNVGSKKCLSAKGGALIVNSCSTDAEQQWSWENIAESGKAGDINDLKIASHNVWFMTVLGTNIGDEDNFQDVSNIEARSRAIVADGYLRGQDIVVLNELFDNGASNYLLNGLKADYPHQTGVAGRSTRGSTEQWDQTLGAYRPRARLEAGVAIVSKWPIERKIQYLFAHADSCGWDSMANKGFAYAKINYRNSMKVHVIATHLQSEEALACEDANDEGSTAGHRMRTKQLQAIRDFVDSQNIPSSEPVFVAGDLNINFGTQEAERMLAQLKARPPVFTGNRGSYDTRDNPLKGPSNLYPEILDYVLALKDHVAPAPWYTEIRKKNGMADHYPVFASSQQAGAIVKPDLSEYKISIHTADRRGAGTDSNIVAIINGESGKSRRIKLNDRVYHNAFERGSIESMRLEAEAMRDPRTLTLEFDDKHPGSDWRINRIELRKVGGTELWVWSGDYDFTHAQNKNFALKKER